MILSFRTGIAQSKAVNHTIDDEKGDSLTRVIPVYTPSDGPWTQGSNCTQCGVSPAFVQASHAYNGTWHDATYASQKLPSSNSGVSVAFNFTGTAVYVYNILVNQIPFVLPGVVTTFTNLTFHIDDELVGNFTHIPDNTLNVMYKHLVYSNVSLANTHHTLEIRASGGKSSLVLFDYAEYTAEDLGDDSDSDGEGEHNSNTYPVSTKSSPSYPTSIEDTSVTAMANTSTSLGGNPTPWGGTGHHPPPSSSNHRFPDTDTPHSHTEMVAWIVGGVLFALGSVAILVVVLLKRRRRRREAGLAPPNRAVEPYPFVGHGPGQPAGDAETAYRYGPPGESSPRGASLQNGIADWHCVDVAARGAGSAPSPGRAAVLVEQIRTLEGRLRALQLERDYGDGYPREKHGDWRGGGDAAGSNGADKPPVTPTEAGARTSRGEGLVEEEMGIEAQSGALAGEIEVLRAELRREQRLAEELPPYA